MMRAVVFSDTHGREDAVERILTVQPDADVYVFLGDGMSEVKRVFARHPEHSLVACPGNCDGGLSGGSMQTFELGGYTIGCCHGDRYSVKSTLDRLKTAAREKGASVALFGHTHVPCCEQEDGLWCVNPGNASSDLTRVRFALVDVTESGLVCCVTSAPLND